MRDPCCEVQNHCCANLFAFVHSGRSARQQGGGDGGIAGHGTASKAGTQETAPSLQSAYSENPVIIYPQHVNVVRRSAVIAS